MLFRCALLAIALSAAAPAAQAALLNSGFEDPVVNLAENRLLGPGEALGTGWIVIGDPDASIYLIQTTYSEPSHGMSEFNAFEGLNSVDLTGLGNPGNSSGVQQAVATTPGQLYRLLFHVGRAGGGPGYDSPATVDVSVDGGPRTSYTNLGISPSMVNWLPQSHFFTATSASTTIAFLNGTPAGANYAGLDGIELIQVPEPTTAALAAMALAAAPWRRRAMLRIA